jgi:hypothetical protein
MSVDDAIACDGNLAREVFSDVKRSGDGKFRATNLKEVIRKIVKKYSGDPEEGMMDSRSNACKTCDLYRPALHFNLTDRSRLSVSSALCQHTT